MNSLRLQFAFSLSVFGCFVPFLSSCLEQERGLDRLQIGTINAWTGVSMLLSPILVTFIADAKLDIRKLIATIFILASLIFGGLWYAHSYAAIAGLMTLLYLVLAPIGPLQDALNFAYQSRALSEGRRVVPYHLVRVFGTIGFMVPTAAMWILQRRGSKIDVSFLVGAACCIAGLVNTLTLAPAPPLATTTSKVRRPTLAALKAFLDPQLLAFSVASLIANVATAAMYVYFPLVVTDEIGLDNAWLGPVFNFGVAIEIFYMLGYGALRRRFGVRRIAIAAALLSCGRLLALALSPTVAALLAGQCVHGLMVVFLNVIPPVFVNRFAAPEFRASVQGLFSVLVVGIGRIGGSLGGALLAERRLLSVFEAGAIAWGVTTLLLLVGLRDGRHVEEG